MMKKETYFNQKEPKYTVSFYITVALLVLFSLMSIGVDIDEFLQHETLHIPIWYFYIIFFVDTILSLGIFLISVFRKVGVYLFPISIFIHFLLHNYYLDTFLYTDVMNLFIYILGLVVLIPKWSYFK